MELRWLNTFLAVAELRHFARAAGRCNVSQPAVSHQIRLLEEAVGARLLNRAGRRVSLTVAGELLLEDARRILADIDRARERVQDVTTGSIGRVRLGATQVAGLHTLPPLLHRYRARYPGFALHLNVAPELQLLERVAANDLDMAVVGGRPALGELRGRRIGSEELVVVAPQASRVARARSVRAVELRDEPWVLCEEGSDTRREADVWFQRHRVAPQAVLTLDGPEAVTRAVAAGFGVGVAARAAVAAALKRRELALVKLANPLPPRDLLVIDHPKKHHGAACRAMLALLEATA